MAKTQFEISDRDFLVAIFDALGALARETTGKTLFVSVCSENGNQVVIYPNTANARLISNPEGQINFPRVPVEPEQKLDMPQ